MLDRQKLELILAVLFFAVGCVQMRFNPLIGMLDWACAAYLALPWWRRAT